VCVRVRTHTHTHTVYENIVQGSLCTGSSTQRRFPPVHTAAGNGCGWTLGGRVDTGIHRDEERGDGGNIDDVYAASWRRGALLWRWLRREGEGESGEGERGRG